MRKTRLIPLCLIILFPLAGSADWSIVSTFGGQDQLSKITDVYYTFTYNGHSSIENGKWVINPGNQSSYVELYSLLYLGEDISAAANPVTVYFEFTQPAVDDGSGGTRKAVTNAFWGLSNKSPQAVNQTNVRKQAFNALQRIDITTDTLQGYDGGVGGSGLVNHQPLLANAIYRIWFVLQFDPLPIYSSYIQGGQWAEQTLLSVSPPWGFYVNPGPTDKVEHFMVTVSVDASTHLDPIHFDNVVIDLTGENLTTPDTAGIDTTWAGYPIHDQHGNVNTGDWLGWVNVKHKPHVYVYSMEKYLYLPEFLIDPEGGWTYAF